MTRHDSEQIRRINKTALVDLKAKVEEEIAHKATYEWAGVYDYNRVFFPCLTH